MPYYSVPGFQGTVAATYKTGAQANVTGSTKRGKTFELIVGSFADPNSTDCSVSCDVSRITATGAGAYTAWTPVPSDTSDGASVAAGGINASAEATAITASSDLWTVAMNQRATVRWIAAQESQYFVWPAVAGNGLVLRVRAPQFNASFATQMNFME